MSGPPPDDGPDLRVGIAFPFDRAALAMFASVSTRVRYASASATTTPHVSGAEARDDLVALVTENLRRFVVGEPLLNRVNIHRGY